MKIYASFLLVSAALLQTSSLLATENPPDEQKPIKTYITSKLFAKPSQEYTLTIQDLAGIIPPVHTNFITVDEIKFSVGERKYAVKQSLINYHVIRKYRQNDVNFLDYLDRNAELTFIPYNPGISDAIQLHERPLFTARLAIGHNSKGVTDLNTEEYHKRVESCYFKGVSSKEPEEFGYTAILEIYRR